MELTEDLKGARLSVARAAELASMHPAHLRRLIRKGVFPKPKRTRKGRPYFDYELLARIAQILKSGIGENSEEIIFYRRKARKRPSQRRARPQPPDQYLTDLAACLRQLGIPRKMLTPQKLRDALRECFGTERPDLGAAIPAITQRLLA